MTNHLTRPALTGAVVAALMLAGCVAEPEASTSPEMRPASSFSSAETLSRIPGSAVWPNDDWWRAYADPQLTELIEEGLKDGPDVAIAVARLHSADGYRRQAHAALLPSATANVNVGEAKQSYNNGIPAMFVPHGWNDTGLAALSVDFDIDLWGKNRAALRAATSDSEAAQLDLEQARLLLSTNIASAYADLARLFAEREVQDEAVRLRQDSQALVVKRVANGLDTKAELKQANSLVPAARAQLAAIDKSIGLTRNQIAALLGKGADRGLAILPPLVMVASRGLPADVTTNLIGRRPDIVAARVRVEAAAERIKVAHADFYPSISLSALIGVQSLGLSNLIKGTSSYGNAGPALSLPIFNSGRIAGQYDVARGTYDQAVATYNQDVATAFHEVADSVTSLSMLGERLGQSRESLADAEEAYAVARRRYEGGLSTYQTVLTAEDTVLQARVTVADLQSRAFTLDVALVRALGGGLVPAPASPLAAAQINVDQTNKE